MGPAARPRAAALLDLPGDAAATIHIVVTSLPSHCAAIQIRERTEMAELIPTRSSCLRRMTAGERRVAERLEDKLEDDYVCWFNVPVGPKQLQPDFIVLHPGRGFLVLEVKDWKFDTLRSVDKTTATLLTDRGLVTEKNPLLQARVYALEVAVLLERDAALRNPADHRHAGKLNMPYGWGVVLTNITRRQFDTAELGQVIDSHRVICADEMTVSADAEAFQQRLWALFNVVFPCRLSLPQVDRVRWHLFPEIRLPHDGQSALFPNLDAAPDSAGLPDLVRIMDMEQERLARSLGDGHRVIHGVAGSGKTMVLGYRSVHLARSTDKPILVLCYNVSLSARLQQLIAERGLEARVAVRNFHAWCRQMLVQFNCELPAQGGGFFEGLVTRIIDAVDKGQVPRGQYGAVLIDEGHDFQPEWFRLVAQMVDPETNSLLVLYDDAQSIYGKGRAKFSFASVGIQARGRTRVLQVNYRNTWELLSVARSFAAELVEGRDADEDGVPVIAPSSSGRRGALPELIRCEDLRTEARFVAERIAGEVQRGTPPDRIGVIYPNAEVQREVARALKDAGIAFRATTDSRSKKALFADVSEVKVVTMESSKGLEFGVVLIPGLGAMPATGEDEVEEARLLYVAMTRAVESLVMTHSRESPFTERLRRAIHDAAAAMAPRP
jgi:hypothetical protein